MDLKILSLNSEKSEEKGTYIIGLIEDNFRNVCSDWTDYDAFADNIFCCSER